MRRNQLAPGRWAARPKRPPARSTCWTMRAPATPCSATAARASPNISRVCCHSCLPNNDAHAPPSRHGAESSSRGASGQTGASPHEETAMQHSPSSAAAAKSCTGCTRSTPELPAGLTHWRHAGLISAGTSAWHLIQLTSAARQRLHAAGRGPPSPGTDRQAPPIASPSAPAPATVQHMAASVKRHRFDNFGGSMQA